MNRLSQPFCFSFKRCVFYFSLCVTLGLQMSAISCSKTCINCDQGRCINDTCVCLPGWRGSLCDECFGRVSLQSGMEGIIYDGAANYSKDLTCSWLLDAGQNNMRIRLQINEFATECIWDHLYIHDGDSAFAPLVAAYSGIHSGLKNKLHLKFKLSGQYAFIHFYSDAAFTLPGFNTSYFIDGCALECSENAVCNNTVCQCHPGWTGENCDILVQGCVNNCSGHGVCVQGVCQCENDYTGDICNVTKGQMYIETVLSASPSALSGRASFSLVVDENKNLWVLGGYKIGDPRKDNNLFTFDITNGLWNKPTEKGKTPWPRYGHTSVYYKNALYVYAGVSNTKIVKDFWMYSMTSKDWSELPPGPRNISGHTAHVVDNVMIVIFGYSSDYGYSNRVLEFNFDLQNWTIVETSGSRVQGGYGHTSVYDETRRKIYVYGGYHSQGPSNYNLTDKLYQYDPLTREWFILHSSGTAKYMHSATMINGLMVTFGGNTHNDTRLGQEAKCFASDFMVYDRDCNRWHSVPSPQLAQNVDVLDRFGHAMVTVDNFMYVFGGFHTVCKNDLLKIFSGTCSYFTERKQCTTSVPGVKCVWTGTLCKQRDQSVSDPSQSVCPGQDPNTNCSGFNTCESCRTGTGVDCHWHGKTCISQHLLDENCCTDQANCTENVDQFCSLFHNCKACQENSKCIWQANTCKHLRKDGNSDAKKTKALVKETCSQKACGVHASCENCTKGGCMWCSNLKQCINTNSYIVYYYYGQCMDWTTKESSCQANNCSTLKTCSDCQARPKCGWCNDESNTGTGTCFEGGMSGPIKIVDGKPRNDSSICPERWFFSGCPKCQCNGHSTCVNDTDVCESCAPPTTGSQCQFCEDGFYGRPENNGTCQPCFCNGQADSCNSVTGDCYCRTRGVTGKTCDRCDSSNKYSGDPKNGGTCYYQLSTDFQYTFNLSKGEDYNYTQIHFLNTPSSRDRDVDFTLNCSTFALINITYRSKSFPEEKEYVTGRVCDFFRTKFEHKNHAFGGKENTTFLVHVYNFQTPFKLQISFVQQDKINLLKFFIIFFSCFLSLLLIAAALWKIKHKYDSYRRRQQLIVEMQQMASRPFSTIAVEFERKSDPVVVDKRDHLDSVLRRRKRAGNKPSAIAIEPLVDHKAAILTLIIQLPTGDSDFAPSGLSGLAVGSALVSMGSNRKQSLEHVKGEKPKIRKNLSYNHPDTCA